MKKLMYTVLTLSVIVLTAAAARADGVPARLGLQGHLTDADGVPADGEWPVTVRLFDTEEGTIPFHDETFTVEPVNGVFTVTLGNDLGNPLPVEEFEDGEVWVAFVVSGGDGPVELSPRLRVGAVPYAFRARHAMLAAQADNAVTLGGVGAGSFVQLTDLLELCVTSEGLPAAIEGLGYTPGAGYSDVDVLTFLDENGYSACACYGDDEVQIYLDLMGYTPGQGYSDEDVAAYLSDQGYPGPDDALLADGSRPLGGDWDVAGNQLMNLVVHNAASEEAPTDPGAGQLWFDTTTDQLKFYTGAEWLSVGTGSVAADLTCEGCVDAADVSFDWALGDTPGGAALSAKALDCEDCVTASHLAVPYAASAIEAGPAADLACTGCVDETEAAFSWAAAATPGGAALVAVEAGNADTVDGVHAVDFEPAGAMAAHAATPHLSEAQYGALTGGGETTLHSHPGGGEGGGSGARLREYEGDTNLGLGGSTLKYLHVFSADTPKVYLYIYGKKSTNLLLPNHNHGEHIHDSKFAKAYYTSSCPYPSCNTVTSGATVGTGSYPLTDIDPDHYPEGIQIWIDGEDMTVEVGDQQAVGTPHWTGASWGAGQEWTTGRLDLSYVINWTAGEHSIELKETGNKGGRIMYSIYVVDPASESQPFANDTCIGAEDLVFTGGIATVKATTEDVLGENKALDDLAPAGCGGAGGGDVVYAVTVEERTTIHSSVSAPFATRLYVLDSPCVDQTVLACDTSTVTTSELDPGTYYVVVDSDGAGQAGDFILTVELEASPLPINDTCDNPATLPAGPVPLVFPGFTTWGLDQYEGTCNADSGAADVVYQFTATTSYDDLAVTVTADWAAVLILRALNCEMGVQLSCSADGTLTIPDLTPGTYYLIVDGASPEDEGSFTLNITLN